LKGMRGVRLAEEIRRELSDILVSRVRDPRLGLATVTRVEVSSDGSHARIFVSFLGDELADASGLKGLESASAFIRGELGRRIEVRRVPELAFRADPGMRHSLRIQAELRRLDLAREAAGAPPSGDPHDGDRPSGDPGDGNAPGGRAPAGGED
jgi:ribosome-binding factor A